MIFHFGKFSYEIVMFLDFHYFLEGKYENSIIFGGTVKLQFNL